MLALTRLASRTCGFSRERSVASLRERLTKRAAKLEESWDAKIASIKAKAADAKAEAKRRHEQPECRSSSSVCGEALALCGRAEGRLRLGDRGVAFAWPQFWPGIPGTGILSTSYMEELPAVGVPNPCAWDVMKSVV